MDQNEKYYQPIRFQKSQLSIPIRSDLIRSDPFHFILILHTTQGVLENSPLLARPLRREYDINQILAEKVLEDI